MSPSRWRPTARWVSPAQAEATAHPHVNWPWWAWALIFWALVAALGLARVEVAGRVLAVLTAAEIIIVLVETISGLASPAGGHLDFAALSPSTMTAAGVGTAGVLAVIALTGFVGFEQSPVLSEEAKNPSRTIPAATYTAVAAAALLYAAAAWAMAVHAGRSHVVAAATAQGPGLLYTLASSSALAQTAQLLFMTSLFAAALSYHNVTWRYMFSLSREGVLPATLSRTSRNSIPRAASITQSASGLAVIGLFAIFGWPPMTGLFFGGGATGGLGVMILLAITSAGIVRYFDRAPGAESVWTRMTAPALSALLLAGAVVLAIMHYGTLLGTAPGKPRRLAASLRVWFRRRGGVGLGNRAEETPARRVRHDRARPPRRPGRCRPRSSVMTARHQPAAGDSTADGLVRASEADIDVLSQVIADAFLDLAPCHWLIADRTVRHEIFPRYFRMYVVHARLTGWSTPPRIASPPRCGFPAPGQPNIPRTTTKNWPRSPISGPNGS